LIAVDIYRKLNGDSTVFWKSKKQKPPKSRPAMDLSGVYEKPKFDEEKTQTLEILLGDIELSLDKETEHGGDPHDNSGRFSVEELRSKSK
jgi:hypothetical protein